MAYRLRLLGQLGRNVGQLVTHGHPRISYGNVRYFRILSRLDVDAQKILMPALSPTMVEGTIVKWHKKEGEAVEAGDILCDIETDKAVVSMEVDEDGIVAKILKPENTKNVKIGSLIALMVAEGEDWKAVDIPADAADSGQAAAPSQPPPSQAPPAQAPSQPAAAGPPSGNAQQVMMPALSPTMVEGTIVKWTKKEGESFSAGDILCDVETDKAVVSFEMDDDGILAKILKPEGTKGVKIGELIALTVAEGEDWQNVSVPSDAGSPPASPASPPAPSGSVTASPPPTQAPTHVSGSVPFGPAARNIMEVYGISPTDVPPTGPGGRLTKGDLLEHIQQKGLKPVPVAAVPSPAGPPSLPCAPGAAQTPPTGATAAAQVPAGQAYVDIELTNMRKTIAQRLTESKATIPHAYSVIDCDMGPVMHLRKSLKEEGVTVSLNDILIKAVAVSLQMVPEVNATWTGEGSRVLSNIDIATAVATEGGLITPIVKNAVGLGLQEISAVIKDLAEKARSGTLQPDEFVGGTFTISNLGMYGVHEFTAIVNPPSASILAVGGTHTELDGEGRPYPALTVTLCSDGRVVDDALAARFLDTFRHVLEKPMLMLSQGAPVDLQALFAK